MTSSHKYDVSRIQGLLDEMLQEIGTLILEKKVCFKVVQPWYGIFCIPCWYVQPKKWWNHYQARAYDTEWLGMGRPWVLSSSFPLFVPLWGYHSNLTKFYSTFNVVQIWYYWVSTNELLLLSYHNKNLVQTLPRCSSKDQKLSVEFNARANCWCNTKG